MMVGFGKDRAFLSIKQSIDLDAKPGEALEARFTQEELREKIDDMQPTLIFDYPSAAAIDRHISWLEKLKGIHFPVEEPPP